MPRTFASAVLLATILVGCAHSGVTHRSSSTPSSGSAAPSGNDGDGEVVERKTIVEDTPEGRKTTIITVTRHTVAAPPPPPRPADPWPDDPLVKYNVDVLNRYRAQGGLPPLLYDAKISAFATDGSEQLADDHSPHAHFAAHESALPEGFGTVAAENQGDPRGVGAMANDPVASGKKQIDTLLRIMMNEGPGEGPAHGHYMNIMNKELRRVGVGLYYAGGKLYLTNDFSN